MDLDKLRDEMFRGKNDALTSTHGKLSTLTNKQTSFSIDCDDGTFTLEQCSDGSGRYIGSWNGIIMPLGTLKTQALTVR